MAHRGASTTHAENTLEAFEAALAAGADAVEFDVRVTADGVAVVIHDAAVDRTTDGHGPVREMTVAQVRSLRVTTGPGGDAAVPTLVEVLDAMTGRAMVDIEIKNIPGEPDFDAEAEVAVEATLRALDRTSFVGDVLISSFNPSSIAWSKTLAPDVPTGLLTIEQINAATSLAFAKEQGHSWVLPASASVILAGEGFPPMAHDADMRVGTWIVDDPATAVDLAAWGIDAIATNDPAKIVRALRPGTA